MRDEGNTFFIKSDIKLTIGILVSNHIKYIRQGMESIRPLLEAVPSELIIVDTVGPENSDGSLDIVKEYTDKIYHFDWIDDFSAARNVAMEHAQGEWFLYFDDDEYFDDVKEIVDFFVSGECEKYNGCYYYTGDYISDKKYYLNVASRMLRRTPNTRFEGIIHEHFNEMYGPLKQFKAFTHHFGYLYETDEQKKKKNLRNINLLQKELDAKGANVWTCAHYVNQILNESYENAARKSLEFIELIKEKEELESSLGQWLLLVNFRYMAKWAGIEIIETVEKELSEQYYLSELARLIINQLEAVIAFSQNDYKKALEHVNKYFDLLSWLKNHEEECNEQVNMDLDSFMRSDKLFEVASIGLVCKAVEEKNEEAYRYIKYIDFSYAHDFSNIINVEKIREIYVYIILKAAPSDQMINFFRKFYKDELFDNKKMSKFLPERVREELKYNEHDCK